MIAPGTCSGLDRETGFSGFVLQKAAQTSCAAFLLAGTHWAVVHAVEIIYAAAILVSLAP